MSYRKKEATGNEKYAGCTYVRLVRVSDHSQEQDSDKAQLAFLDDWAKERKMVWVRDFVENDLSGSLPGNRTDLAELLKQADELNNFQFVIAQRVDRTTRGGVGHLFWLDHELRKRGVRLIHPGEDLPEGIPYEDSIRAFKADAAKDYAFSISQRSTQGSQFALEGRRVSPHSKTPFGTYRLYCRPDSTPLHVIKDLRDGRQEKLTYPELQLIDTYGQIGGGGKGHYRKQKSELVFLVPGEPTEHELIIRIFRLRYIQGYAGRKIASILNAEGVRAPMGGKWAARQVESIYENEDYTGVAYANRKTAAYYNARQKGRPKRMVMDDRTATTADRIHPELRDREEWFETTEPYLIDFLSDENLRQLAMAQQKLMWDRKLDPTWVRPNTVRRADSPYLLQGLLAAKQDNELLVGTLTGATNRPDRRYRHKRAMRESQVGSIYSRTFQADRLEQAVLTILQEILLDWPELESRLLAHVQRQIATSDQSGDQLEVKKQKRSEVSAQLLLYVRMLTPKTQSEIKPEISSLEAQRDALDVEIEMLKRKTLIDPVDPNVLAATVNSRLQNLAASIQSLPPNILKQTLAALTASLVADMETKEVTFAFHLPSWAIFESKTDFAEMCMRTNRGSSTGAHTHRDDAFYVPLAHGTCTFQLKRTVSCKCRREITRKAA